MSLSNRANFKTIKIKNTKTPNLNTRNIKIRLCIKPSVWMTIGSENHSPIKTKHSIVENEVQTLPDIFNCSTNYNSENKINTKQNEHYYEFNNIKIHKTDKGCLANQIKIKIHDMKFGIENNRRNSLLSKINLKKGKSKSLNFKLLYPQTTVKYIKKKKYLKYIDDHRTNLMKTYELNHDQRDIKANVRTSYNPFNLF